MTSRAQKLRELRTSVPLYGGLVEDSHDLDLNESDRQLVLLALAVLSLESPGLDYALNEIAKRIDNVHAGRAVTYDVFRESRRKPPPPPCLHPIHKALTLADQLDEEQAMSFGATGSSGPFS